MRSLSVGLRSALARTAPSAQSQRVKAPGAAIYLMMSIVLEEIFTIHISLATFAPRGRRGPRTPHSGEIKRAVERLTRDVKPYRESVSPDPSIQIELETREGGSCQLIESEPGLENG